MQQDIEPRADDSETNSIPEEEIESRCDKLRAELRADMDQSAVASRARNLKAHQVHELAAAKINESERLRRALKISSDYKEGSHWQKQEERERLRNAAEAPPPPVDRS